jgi:BASS family bile acid:Na+ symporter
MMMFVVGLELSLEDFRRIRGYPKPVLVGTASQLIILPLIAAVLAFVLDPPRHIVAGMVLVAACPGGAISNYYVYLARANVALSVTLTAVTTVLAFVTLPVLTALGFTLLLDQQEAIPIPISDMMSQLFVVLLLPTAAGMWLRHRWTAWVRRHGNLLRQLSMGALVLLIAFIIQDQAENLAAQIGELLLTAVLFTLFAMAAGIAIGRGLGLPSRDWFCFVVEYAARNLAIATVVGASLLGQTEFVLFAAAFFLIQVPLMLVAIAFQRLRGSDRVVT